jgi:hypothetical protein|tara:strand:- start:248 stop:628 length:381 start_codon:yes stop_codon:yes gene_type:complete
MRPSQDEYIAMYGQTITSVRDKTACPRILVKRAIRTHTRAGDPSPGGAKSTLYRVKLPKIFTWSMVWFAPVSRSSGGRSAVNNNSGALLALASTAAGSKLATAVPLLVMTHAPADEDPAPLPTPKA